MPQPVRSLFDQAASFLGALGQAPGQVHVRVWREISPWLRDLMQLAGVKWLERLAADVKCQVARRDKDGVAHVCLNASVLECLVCHRPICIRHAFIDSSGEGVCFPCVGGQMHATGHVPKDHEPAKSNGKPDGEEIGWARKTLKVKASASWDDVRAAWRKQSAKHHPDRVQDDDAKIKAEAKFKDVQKAFEMLKQHYGGNK